MLSSVLLPDFAVYFFYCFLSFGTYKGACKICMCCVLWISARRFSQKLLSGDGKAVYISFTFLMSSLSAASAARLCRDFYLQRLGDFVCLYFLCVRMLMYPWVLFYTICKRTVFLIDQDSARQRRR